MIKRVVLLLAALLTYSVAQAQIGRVKYKLDPYGQKVSSGFWDLGKKYPNNAMAFRITADSGRIYQYNAPRYSAYKINYSDFRKKIENVTGKTFSEPTTFIIYYRYKDDICSDSFSNNEDKELTKQSKEYHDPFKAYIEKTYPNSVFLVLYEKGISLSNNPQSENEYFFSDKDNYIRKAIFRTPTVCGSFSIVKHDGNTLVYNGENTADAIAGHLNPELWNSIFKTQ